MIVTWTPWCNYEGFLRKHDITELSVDDAPVESGGGDGIDLSCLPDYRYIDHNGAPHAGGPDAVVLYCPAEVSVTTAICEGVTPSTALHVWNETAAEITAACDLDRCRVVAVVEGSADECGGEFEARNERRGDATNGRGEGEGAFHLCRLIAAAVVARSTEARRLKAVFEQHLPAEKSPDSMSADPDRAYDYLVSILECESESDGESDAEVHDYQKLVRENERLVEELFAFQCRYYEKSLTDQAQKVQQESPGRFVKPFRRRLKDKVRRYRFMRWAARTRIGTRVRNVVNW